VEPVYYWEQEEAEEDDDEGGDCPIFPGLLKYVGLQVRGRQQWFGAVVGGDGWWQWLAAVVGRLGPSLGVDGRAGAQRLTATGHALAQPQT
jgi:hypothetical protein